jgi:hypothetical protein
MDSDARGQGKASPRHRPTGAVCEVCGKSEDRCFEVHLGGERHVFDSFECAIRGLMPKCPLCGAMILGTGVQAGNQLFCSHACASLSSVVEVEAHSRTVHPRNY